MKITTVKKTLGKNCKKLTLERNSIEGIFQWFWALVKMICLQKNEFLDPGDVIHFLANESPLKVMENAFCYTLKALIFLKAFQFLSWLFRQIEERLN